MQVLLTNLSDGSFSDSRQLLNLSASKFGIETIFSYDFEDLVDTTFYNNNYSIITQPKGLGYWLWKPYIILDAFSKVNEGDIVIYADCGIKIIGDLKPLIELCKNETEILVFANSDYTNKIWTKRDCFVLMDCDEEKYWNGIHCDAAFILLRKSSRTKKFVEDWLLFGSDPNILTDTANICGQDNFPEFIEHRRDQSILSLLVIKYGVPFYRMPTQFGNHYKTVEYRVANEFNCINQRNQTQVNYYAELPFANSPYPQLLDHHRKKTESTITDYPADNKLRISKPIHFNLVHFKSLLKSFINRILPAPFQVTVVDQPTCGKVSYSQCGEDLIVDYIFNLRGIERPSYIDIGANHPYHLSNTAFFYKKGCRGINIEANPNLINEFVLHRPEDINLNIGIGEQDAELDFYVMEDNTLSTFAKAGCELMIGQGKQLAGVQKVKLTKLSNILIMHAANKFPDFMSIDSEGMDFEILQSIDFTKYWPKIICVEAAEYSPVGSGARRNELIDFLVAKGYYEYANTNLNAIMVKNEFWFI